MHSCSYFHSAWTSLYTFYCPQRSWGKVIFSEAGVKNSVHGGDALGSCVAGGVHGRGCVWRGGVHGRYYEIWSMSGRYASYWNAYLFFLNSEVKINVPQLRWFLQISQLRNPTPNWHSSLWEIITRRHVFSKTLCENRSCLTIPKDIMTEEYF